MLLPLLWFDCDQAMLSLPLLIGILSIGDCQKLMIIESRLLVVTEMIVAEARRKKQTGGICAFSMVRPLSARIVSS